MDARRARRRRRPAPRVVGGVEILGPPALVGRPAAVQPHPRPTLVVFVEDIDARRGEDRGQPGQRRIVRCMLAGLERGDGVRRKARSGRQLVLRPAEKGAGGAALRGRKEHGEDRSSNRPGIRK
jgi:hypothetical protein